MVEGATTTTLSGCCPSIIIDSILASLNVGVKEEGEGGDGTIWICGGRMIYDDDILIVGAGFGWMMIDMR